MATAIANHVNVVRNAALRDFATGVRPQAVVARVVAADSGVCTNIAPSFRWSV